MQRRREIASTSSGMHANRDMSSTPATAAAAAAMVLGEREREREGRGAGAHVQQQSLSSNRRGCHTIKEKEVKRATRSATSKKSQKNTHTEKEMDHE